MDKLLLVNILEIHIKEFEEQKEAIDKKIEVLKNTIEIVEDKKEAKAKRGKKLSNQTDEDKKAKQREYARNYMAKKRAKKESVVSIVEDDSKPSKDFYNSNI